MTTQLQLLNPQLQSLPFPPPRVDMQTGQINLADWNDFLLRLAAVTGNSASFSSGTGVNEIPQNYSQFNTGALPPMSGTDTRTYDTSWTLFGLASLKITGSGTTYFGATTGSFPFVLAPSQKWIISVYTKATQSQTPITLGITTAAGSYTVNLQTHAVAGDVLRIYGSLDLTTDSSSAFNVYVQTSQSGTDSAWFDGFMLEPQSGTTGTPSPYSLNTPSTVLNTNPPGGVVNNLPYINHDVSVRTTLASTAGADGSYLNPSQVLNRHLNQANQDGLSDGTTFVRGLASEHTSNAWDPSKAQNINAQNQYLSAISGGQKNMLPDSDWKYNLVYWPGASGLAFKLSRGANVAPGGFTDNCMNYPVQSSGYNYVYSLPITVQAGNSVVLSGWAYTNNVASGSIAVFIYSWANNTLGSSLSLISWTSAQSETRQSATFIIPTGVTQIVVVIDSNNANITGFTAVQHLQLEAGTVATAYRSNDDASGFGVYSGSGPVTVPTTQFTYTSTTSSITWSWSGMSWYNADGTLATVSNSNMATTGLAASYTYYSYPYYDLVAGGNVLWVAGGSGNNGNEHTSKSASLVAQQNNAKNIPLSSGGMLAATPASGSGGGGGGGNSCLHPDATIRVRSSFTYDKRAAELQAGDLVDTPSGYQPITSVEHKPQSDWIKLTFADHSTITVTPSHIVQKADGSPIAVKNLTVGTLLKTKAGVTSVIGLNALNEESYSIVLDVPGHWFYPDNFVLHHNGTVKP